MSSPVSQSYFGNSAVFTYAIKTLSLPGSNDPYTALGFTTKTLNASAPIILDIPQYADKICKSIKIKMPGILSASCVSTSGDTYRMPARLRAYGNLPGGAFPVKFDGQPLMVYFTQNSSELIINGPLSKIEFSAMEIELDFDMSQLVTTPAFTADTASTDWGLVLLLRPVIELDYTNG